MATYDTLPRQVIEQVQNHAIARGSMDSGFYQDLKHYIADASDYDLLNMYECIARSRSWKDSHRPNAHVEPSFNFCQDCLIVGTVFACYDCGKQSPDYANHSNDNQSNDNQPPIGTTASKATPCNDCVSCDECHKH